MDSFVAEEVKTELVERPRRSTKLDHLSTSLNQNYSRSNLHLNEESMKENLPHVSSSF